MPLVTANVDEEELGVARRLEGPQPTAVQEVALPRLMQERQPPILESSPQPILTSPLRPSPAHSTPTLFDDLNTQLQLPLNGTITAVFSGAQNIAIEAVYITVNQGNTTNLVAENVRWSIRETGTSFKSCLSMKEY